MAELKARMKAETNVEPAKQKFVGLKLESGGGLPSDATCISELLIKPGQKLMMLG